MSEDSATPGHEDLTAALLSTLPDGTDWARVVRDDAAWAAFSQPFAAMLAPEFVYEDNVLPDHAGETYHGLEGMRRASAGWVEAYEELLFDLERAVGSGDCVVSIHRVRAKARHSGIVQEGQAAYIWTYRDRRLVRCEAFADAGEALEAAGLEA